MSTGKGARYFRVRRKPDANQKAIVDALRAAGRKVFDLSGVGGGCPDVAVLRADKSILLLEIKMPGGRVRKKQDDVHQDWPVTIVRSVDEALRAAGVIA